MQQSRPTSPRRNGKRSCFDFRIKSESRADSVELFLTQEAALAEVRKAAEELQLRQKEVDSAKKELTQAQEEKNRASGDIDAAAKILTGDEAMVAKLADGLKRDGFAYVDNFLGEPLATYILQEVGSNRILVFVANFLVHFPGFRLWI
jgi:hypothetical protein